MECVAVFIFYPTFVTPWGLPTAPAQESPVDTLHYSPVHGPPDSAMGEVRASREEGDVPPHAAATPPEKPSSQSFQQKGSDPTATENASQEIPETKGSEGAKSSDQESEGFALEPAGSAVATPCRTNDGLPPMASPGEVESTLANTPTESEVDSPDASRPVPGELRLSQNAINCRLHRVMKIDSKGNCRVSEKIREQFHSKKGKLRVQQLFQTCGYDVELGC